MAQKYNDILRLEKVSVGYDNRAVARDISLSIKSGEMFGLIGVNGAGKTSLIKSIIGLRDHISGEITFFDGKILDEDCKKQFAYLPERFDPPWFLSGVEFAKFALALYGKKFDRDQLDEYCDFVRLDKAFLSKRMNTYSKGMRQKLGLITTLMSDVPLLILDEPMSGLDPIARVNVKNLLLRAMDRGQTILICSHILADMDALCGRIAVLNNQEIQFIGAPNDLKAKYSVPHLEQAFLEIVQSQQDQAA